MTYLILDTNVWFYLANSYNPKNQNYEDDIHFKLVEMLTNLVNNKKITILTNAIIIEEWNKNKKIAKNLIIKYQKSIEGNRGHVNNIKKFLVQEDKTALDDIFEKYISCLNLVIENNERHISQVEDLLVNKTEKVEITHEIKSRAADRAISKLAPFKGDKSNSMADAVILLSAVEYLKKISKHSAWDEDQEEFYTFPSSTFVTINKGDFANPDNENEIHPELKPVLEEAEMVYEANIGRALNTINAELINRAELEQIEREMEEEYWNNIVYCEVCDPDLEKVYVNNIIKFGEPIEIDNEFVEYNDPNQMKLFDLPAVENKEVKENKRSDVHTVQFGNCTWCNAEYIKCQYCGAINHVGDFIEDNKLECDGCGITYEFIHRYIGDGMHETEVKIINEENEEEE